MANLKSYGGAGGGGGGGAGGGYGVVGSPGKADSGGGGGGAGASGGTGGSGGGSGGAETLNGAASTAKKGGGGGGGGGTDGAVYRTGSFYEVSSLSGTNGGAGGASGSADYIGAGGGGSGGFGLVALGPGATILTRSGSSLAGGAGGNGAAAGGNDRDYGGSGGDGGCGAYFVGTNSRLLLNGSVADGGTAGAGGAGFNYRFSGRSGHGGTGVLMLGSGGYIYNSLSSTIQGGSSARGYGGVGAALVAGGTIRNSGTIQGGAGGDGDLGGQGIVGSGLAIDNSGSAATIAGGGQADAIDLNGGMNSLALGGTIDGGIGVTGSLTLTTTADITVANVIHGPGSLIYDNTSTLTLSGANAYGGGTTIEAGTLVFANSAGTGPITFSTSGTATAKVSLGSAAQTFDGTSASTLANFDTQNVSLDLEGFKFDGDTSYQSDGTTLSVGGGKGGRQYETFNLTNGTTAYTAKDDGSGGTLLTPVCFAGGTALRVVRGGVAVDVPVEDLAVGDLIVTASGAHRPIRWLGHRRLDCRRHPRPQTALPVRIAAHALAPDRPARDLLVSPGHAICVDVVGEVLIPAIALVNGASVRQVAVDAVTYWHVELDSHDILLAENLPAESYIDMGNRGFFDDSNVIQLRARTDAAPGSRAAGVVPLSNATQRAKAAAGSGRIILRNENDR